MLSKLITVTKIKYCNEILVYHVSFVLDCVYLLYLQIYKIYIIKKKLTTIMKLYSKIVNNWVKKEMVIILLLTGSNNH